MPEDLAHNGKRDAGHQRVARGRVAKIVEPNPLKARNPVADAP